MRTFSCIELWILVTDSFVQDRHISGCGHIVPSTHLATFQKDLLPSPSHLIVIFLLTPNYMQQVSATYLHGVISQRLFYSRSPLSEPNTLFGSISPLRFYLRLVIPFIFLFSFISFCFCLFPYYLLLTFLFLHFSTLNPLLLFIIPHFSSLPSTTPSSTHRSPYCFLHSLHILILRYAATRAHCAPSLSRHSSLPAFPTQHSQPLRTTQYQQPQIQHKAPSNVAPDRYVNLTL